MFPRWLWPSLAAALPSLTALVVLSLHSAAAFPFPSPSTSPLDANAEVDSDATQRVLGSSVVTSVSVIMDLGNGTKVVAAPQAGERIPAVASPASLMHPDRYEFYTFDEAGDLVKRYMTLPQIQSMIAGGDGSPSAALSGLGLQPLGEGRVPAVDALDAPPAHAPAPPGVVVAGDTTQDAPMAEGVREVVDRVQNVLRSELEANKNKVPTPGASPPTAPLAEDTADTSGAWSVLLPAMMGSALETSPSPSSATSTTSTTPTTITTNATTQQTTAKDEPTEAPTSREAETTSQATVSTSTEKAATVKPSPAPISTSTPKQAAVMPEIVTETSMSASFSSGFVGDVKDAEKDDSSEESSEEVSSSSSVSTAGESDESQESSESVASPAETQRPQTEEAPSQPPKSSPTTPEVTATALPQTSTSTTTPTPKPTTEELKTTQAASSETPMLLTVEEPSSETPMLIPVVEPSSPSPQDIQKPLKTDFSQRPIIVPDQHVPTTTEEVDTVQLSEDSSHKHPSTIAKPVSSSELPPPSVTEKLEMDTTIDQESTTFGAPEKSHSQTENVPDQEAQSQKIPTLFLGLLPPFPGPLDDSPSLPDEIPVIPDDPVPITTTESQTEAEPPITTYRPTFSASSTPKETVDEVTDEAVIQTEKVPPSRLPEPSQTARPTSTTENIALKQSPSNQEPVTVTTVSPPSQATTHVSTVPAEPAKEKDSEKPEATAPETVEDNSNQLKEVTVKTPTTSVKLSPTTVSTTEEIKVTTPQSTQSPSSAPTSTAPNTAKKPENNQPNELDISQELADSLSSVLSQVAEQPTTILSDLEQNDKLKPEETNESSRPDINIPDTPVSTTTEKITVADSEVSAGTALKTTLPAQDATTLVPEETSTPAPLVTKNEHPSSTETEEPSKEILDTSSSISHKQPITTEQVDDRLNKVTPRPVTVTLVELAPVFNQEPIKPSVLIQKPSTTTTTKSPMESEPAATDKTIPIDGSVGEEFVNNKEIEKVIEKEAEDDKDNDALVKRQEEAETQASEHSTSVKVPETTTAGQKISESIVATTTPKSSTFQIIVQDSPVVYEDEATFNSYTSTSRPPSPSPFTASPSSLPPQPTSSEATSNESIEELTTQSTAEQTTLSQTEATTTKLKETSVITTPAIKLLPPDPLIVESDKEGTDVVNNSQGDEEQRPLKDARPQLKVDPDELAGLASEPFASDQKEDPTTSSLLSEEATNVPTTPCSQINEDPTSEETTLNIVPKKKYEESPVTETPEAPSPTTLEAEEATIFEDNLWKLRDQATTELPSNTEQDNIQPTDAPTHSKAEKPLNNAPAAEATTEPVEDSQEEASPGNLKDVNVPEKDTLGAVTAAAVTTELPDENEDISTEKTGTILPIFESDQPQDKLVAFNRIAEAEKTEDTKTQERTEKPDDISTEIPEKAGETEKPEETTEPLTTEKTDDSNISTSTEQLLPQKQEETEKPTFIQKGSVTERPEEPAETETPLSVTTEKLEVDKPTEIIKPTTYTGTEATELPETTEKLTTDQTTQASALDETQKPTESADSVEMEPATTFAAVDTAGTTSQKPLVQEKLETSSSSSVFTKLGAPANPEEEEDLVVVLITRPPVNKLGVKDSAQDVQPTTRPRPPPSLEYEIPPPTSAPELPPHQPLVTEKPTLPPAPAIFVPTSAAPPPSVALDPAPGENPGLEVTTQTLGSDVRKFADLCNELAFRLWGAVTVRGLHSGRSVVMSPMGVTSTLAMVFLGARGPTSGQMNDILKLDDMVTFNPHQVFRNVTESVVIGRHPGIATAAFVRQLYSDRSKGRLLDFYKERAQQFYEGHVEEVNFGAISDVVRRRTNMLVKRQTRGRVPEYLRGSHIQLHPPLAAFGANIFQTDCSAASTEGRDGEMYFTVLPGSRQRRLVLVPAAVWRSDFLAGYDPHLDCTAAAIGDADALVSVVLLLPGQQGQLAAGDGVSALERRLTEPSHRRAGGGGGGSAWSRVLRSLLPRPGLELQLPRFSHRSLLNVTAALQRMGLRDLFSADKADLRGLNGVANDLHLSDIVQVNTFSTCAEGTTGGRQQHAEVYPAGSGRSGRGDLTHVPLALRPRQGREPEPLAEVLTAAPRLRFDRPFLYAVRHNPTGFILHMGRFNPHLLH